MSAFALLFWSLFVANTTAACCLWTRASEQGKQGAVVLSVLLLFVATACYAGSK